MFRLWFSDFGIDLCNTRNITNFEEIILKLNLLPLSDRLYKIYINRKYVSKTNISDISVEVLESILARTSISDLSSCSRIGHRGRNIVNNNFDYIAKKYLVSDSNNVFRFRLSGENRYTFIGILRIFNAVDRKQVSEGGKIYKNNKQYILDGDFVFKGFNNAGKETFYIKTYVNKNQATGT